MTKQILNVRTGKPLAGYECRDVEQFRKLTINKEGPGAPEGNLNRLVHGVYANRFLTDEEQVIFHELVGRLRDDFSFNKSSDFIQVELVSIYFLKLARSMEHDDWDAASKIDGMLRGHLKDLKSTKIVREGIDTKKPETTPAEWAATLLEQYAESEKKSKRKTESGKTKEQTFD